MSRVSFVLSAALLCTSRIASAQQGHDHARMASASAVTQPGEAGYAAISEVVRILEADSATDWSKVDLEKLRMHLADMHEVTINAVIRQTHVAEGIIADVTGSGRTAAAIKRLAVAHGRTATAATPFNAQVTELENGARVLLTVRGGGEKQIQKLRALGFIGWLTLDDHHAPHHLMMARGTSNPAH